MHGMHSCAHIHPDDNRGVAAMAIVDLVRGSCRGQLFGCVFCHPFVRFNKLWYMTCWVGVPVSADMCSYHMAALPSHQVLAARGVL